MADNLRDDARVDLHGPRDMIGALLLVVAITIMHKETWREIAAKANSSEEK